MTNIQEYIKEIISKGITEIDARGENLSGELDLTEITEIRGKLDLRNNNITKLIVGENPNLEKIDISNNQINEITFKNPLPELKEINCSNNHLSGLDLANCSNLKILDCSKNSLTEITGQITNLTNLRARVNRLNKNSLYYANPATLLELDIRNNAFNFGDLEVYGKFTKLRILLIGNDNDELRNSVFNQFSGSLRFLQDLNNLERLHIGNTRIDWGLEYLPKNLKEIEFEQGLDFSLTNIRKIVGLLESHDLKKSLGSFKSDNGYSYDLEKWRKKTKSYQVIQDLEKELAEWSKKAKQNSLQLETIKRERERERERAEAKPPSW